MNDPTVEIGIRTFQVPEFSIWAQRQVTPRLTRIAKIAGNVESAEMWADLLDTIYFCLTIQTTNDRPDGPKVNDISKEDFESLKIRSMPMAAAVLPVLFVQAGLQSVAASALGGAGAVEPKTPLSGETTSTTGSPISSSDSTSTGTPASA